MHKVWLLSLSLLFVISICATSANGECYTLSKSGNYISENGDNVSAGYFFGICDTTILPFTLMNGSYLGMNANFPEFNGKLDVNNLDELFYSYFWFCDYYNVKIVDYFLQ